MSKKLDDQPNTSTLTGAKKSDASAEEIAEAARLLRDRSTGEEEQSVKQGSEIEFSGGVVGFAKREPVISVLSAAIIILMIVWFVFFS